MTIGNGQVGYCPPELLHRQGRDVTIATPAWDIWAVGAVFVELLTGIPLKAESVLAQLGQTETVFEMAGFLPDLALDRHLLDLLWCLVRSHPRQRSTAHDAMCHPFFILNDIHPPPESHGAAATQPPLGRPSSAMPPPPSPQPTPAPPPLPSLADAAEAFVDGASLHGAAEAPLESRGLWVGILADGVADEVAALQEEWGAEQDEEQEGSEVDFGAGVGMLSPIAEKPKPEPAEPADPSEMSEPAGHIDEKSFNPFVRKRRQLSATEIERWARGMLCRKDARRRLVRLEERGSEGSSSLDRPPTVASGDVTWWSPEQWAAKEVDYSEEDKAERHKAAIWIQRRIKGNQSRLVLLLQLLKEAGLELDSGSDSDEAAAAAAAAGVDSGKADSSRPPSGAPSQCRHCHMLWLPSVHQEERGEGGVRTLTVSGCSRRAVSAFVIALDQLRPLASAGADPGRRRLGGGA